jgi:hypothetical protein
MLLRQDAMLSEAVQEAFVQLHSKGEHCDTHLASQRCALSTHAHTAHTCRPDLPRQPAGELVLLAQDRHLRH